MGFIKISLTLGKRPDMSTKKGRHFEDLAERYLTGKRYKILGKNLRIGYKEIDILAMDGDCLVVVEVKAHGFDSIHLNQAMSKTKLSHLVSAINQYIVQHNHEGEVRIDVIEIKTSENNVITHYPEAFIL